MIEKLVGTHETVLFGDSVIVKLHDNDEAESYPMHWHLPAEIIMPVVNQYGIRCGNMMYNLREEDILLVQPGVLHECIAPDFGRRFFCQVTVPAPLITKMEQAAIGHILPPTMLITPEVDKELHAQIRTLLYQINSQDTTVSLMRDFTKHMRVLQIIHLIYSYFEMDAAPHNAERHPKTEVATQLRKACAYIAESFAEEITLDDVAREAGFSKFHFSRLFRAYTGMTFYHYVVTVRMSTAKIMLTNPQNSVTSVAYSVGYSSMSSFIRMFKEFYGCTPSAYRQMMEGKNIAIAP